MPLALTTPRLHLRPTSLQDADAFYRMFSNPQNIQYWSEPAWTDTRQAEARVAFLSDAYENKGDLPLTIIRRDSGEVIGTCSLFSFNRQCRRAEIGYSLDIPCWGHGYGSEALTSLLDHAFGELGLNRIEADIDPRNARSKRLLERLGFTFEGLLRQRWIVNGEVSDTGLYGLLAKEWASKPGQAPAS